MNILCPCNRHDRTCSRLGECDLCRKHHLDNGGHPACYDNSTEKFENWKNIQRRK